MSAPLDVDGGADDQSNLLGVGLVELSAEALGEFGADTPSAGSGIYQDSSWNYGHSWRS
jgi:hypothetical protein